MTGGEGGEGVFGAAKDGGAKALDCFFITLYTRTIFPASSRSASSYFPVSRLCVLYPAVALPQVQCWGGVYIWSVGGDWRAEHVHLYIIQYSGEKYDENQSSDFRNTPGRLSKRTRRKNTREREREKNETNRKWEGETKRKNHPPKKIIIIPRAVRALFFKLAGIRHHRHFVLLPRLSFSLSPPTTVTNPPAPCCSLIFSENFFSRAFPPHEDLHFRSHTYIHTE